MSSKRSLARYAAALIVFAAGMVDASVDPVTRDTLCFSATKLLDPNDPEACVQGDAANPPSWAKSFVWIDESGKSAAIGPAAAALASKREKFGKIGRAHV